MLALAHLEIRRIASMLPLLGVMLIFGLMPVLLQQDQGGVVGIVFLTMASVVLVFRLFPLDPAGERVNALVGTLPVSRRQVVVVRYALAFISIAMASCLAAVILPDSSSAEKLGVGAIVAAITLVNVALVGALSGRGGFGAIGPVLPAIPISVLIVVLAFIPDGWKHTAFTFVLENPATSAWSAGAVVLALVTLSFLLSVRWFERRDL